MLRLTPCIPARVHEHNLLAATAPSRPAGDAGSSLCTEAQHALRSACRECWAQEPVARPAFDDIVERLQELLEGESGAC